MLLMLTTWMRRIRAIVTHRASASDDAVGFSAYIASDRPSKCQEGSTLDAQVAADDPFLALEHFSALVKHTVGPMAM